MTTRFFTDVLLTRRLSWQILPVFLILILATCQPRKSDWVATDTVAVSDTRSGIPTDSIPAVGETSVETKIAKDPFHWPTWIVSLKAVIDNPSAPAPDPDRVSLRHIEKFSSDKALEYGLSYDEMEEGSFFIYDACSPAYDEHLELGVQTATDSVVVTIGLMNNSDSRVFIIQQMDETIYDHLLVYEVLVTDRYSGNGPYTFRLSEVSMHDASDEHQNRITTFLLEDVTPDGFGEQFPPMYFVISSDMERTELPYQHVSQDCGEFSDN